jgi:hypothetical protein
MVGQNRASGGRETKLSARSSMADAHRGCGDHLADGSAQQLRVPARPVPAGGTASSFVRQRIPEKSEYAGQGGRRR